MKFIKTRMLYAIFFMIQKGYQDLIHEIKMPSCQMQPNGALIFILIWRKLKTILLSPHQMKKDQIEIDNDFSSNTRGTGEKQGALSSFLLLIFHMGTDFQLR